MAEAAVKKSGWTRVAFGDVVRLCKERSPDPGADGLERYVGLEHLDPGDLKIRRWGNVHDGTTFTNVFRPGKVLFGKRRAYQRKVAVADFRGVCSGDIYVFESKDPDLLFPKLLPFICQTNAFFEHAVGTSAGSLSPRTNWKSLATYEFALTSLEQQRRITEVLQAVEEAIERTSYLLAETERLRAFDLETFFGSHRSQSVPLRTVATIVSGKTPPRSRKELWDGGLPWASGKDLKGRYLTTTEDTLTRAGWDQAVIAPAGATLIVVRGMILAHTFPVSQCVGPVAFNQDLRALVPSTRISADYLTLWTEWAASWFLARTSESSHGTKRLESNVLDEVCVPLPSQVDRSRLEARQRQLVDYRNKVTSRVGRMKELKKVLLANLLERKP